MISFRLSLAALKKVLNSFFSQWTFMAFAVFIFVDAVRYDSVIAAGGVVLGMKETDIVCP